MRDVATQYRHDGLCVLPAKRAEKRPAVSAWKRYRQTPPTEAELSAWFANEQDALCILCGAVSGNLEIIDFDAGGELFAAWWDRVPDHLRERLVVEITPSGGYHVAYRCESPVSGNLKLAQRKVDDQVVTLIETRGEGGLFLCAPTMGYILAHGDLADLPVLTAEERDTLLQAAWELNEYTPPPIDGASRPCGAPTRVPDGDAQSDRPGDDFNMRGDPRKILLQHGWSLARAGENELWRRPGKQSGWSATLKDCSGGGVFYVFSSNAAPFEPNRAYAPFAVYALLEHGGDFEQAARALRREGYGNDESPKALPGVDISGIVAADTERPIAPHQHPADDAGPAILRLGELMDDFAGLNPPVLHGLLREGETMNVIASPKVGKSWFVSALAICVASGLDWLGLAVEQGRVLHIDNELHTCTSAYRYGVISEAMSLPHRLYSDSIDLVSLRGRLRDLYAMRDLFGKVEPGQYKLVIIDAFYRTLPRDTDENDNGAIANLYNYIDHYAAQLKCAFVLIHHTSKGNQSGKAVTDVGAGAGSQSRAADTHLVLRPHEEDDVVVLESAVRSWPPMQARALQWKWPLFIPTEDVDTTALLGAAKPKPQPKEVAVDEFIEQCIAANDPCSKRSVCYEAAQRFGLSERKAEEMLNLAMERGLVSRIRVKSAMQYVKNRPGASGDKALWVAALLAHDPDADVCEVAQTVGVSDRYVRKLRNEINGIQPELQRN